MQAPETIEKNGVLYKRFGVGRSGGNVPGRHVYYAARLEDAIRTLDAGKSANYHYLYIFNRIQTLVSGLAVSNSEQRKDTHTAFRLNMAGTILHYQMISGVAYIQWLELADGDYKDDIVNKRMAGLYLAEQKSRDGKEWRVSRALSKLETHHVAVNGDVGEIDEVMQFMPKMIEEAYKDKSQLKSEGFSLFYSPSRGGDDGAWVKMRSRMNKKKLKEADKAVRSEIVELLSASIEEASGRKVMWTVQGSGSEVFVEALERLRLRLQSIQSDGLDLSAHKAVFFNSHTNEMKIKSLLDDIKMGVDAKAGLYSAKQVTSNFRGHSKFHSEKMKEEGDADNPSRKKEAMKTEHLSWDISAVPVTLVKKGTPLVLGALYVFDNWGALTPQQQKLAFAGMAGTAVAVGVYDTVKYVRRTMPKHLALLKLMASNVTGNRHRLDQLTESSPESAALQLKRLKAGKAL